MSIFFGYGTVIGQRLWREKYTLLIVPNSKTKNTHSLLWMSTIKNSQGHSRYLPSTLDSSLSRVTLCLTTKSGRVVSNTTGWILLDLVSVTPLMGHLYLGCLASQWNVPVTKCMFWPFHVQIQSLGWTRDYLLSGIQPIILQVYQGVRIQLLDYMY